MRISHVHLGLAALSPVAESADAATCSASASASATLARRAARAYEDEAGVHATSVASAAELPPTELPPPGSKQPLSSRRNTAMRASLAGVVMGGGLAGAAPPPGGLAAGVEDRPMRRMRLRDELELPREMTDGTVLYLSPHYRLLPASGVGGAGSAGGAEEPPSNMYAELSAQLGALGVQVSCK